MNRSISTIEGNRRRSWISIAVGTVIGCFLGVGAGSSGPSVFYLAGYCLVLAGIVWAIVWFAFVRPTPVLKGPVLFGCIYLAILVCGISASGFAKIQGETARASILEMQRRMANGDRNIDATPVAKGEAGIVEGFIKGRMVLAASRLDDYEREMKATGIQEMFSKASLTRPDALTSVEASITSAEAVVEKYAGLNAGLYQEGAQQVATLAISPAVRQQLLDGMAQASEQQKPLVDEAWSLQRHILKEYRWALAVLKAGRWKFQGDTLVFARPADLVAFNQHLDAVDALVKRQDEVWAALRQGGSAAAP